LKMGYRHIDCAVMYGNEGACASAIRMSGIAREEIFFTSKIPASPKDPARALSYEFAKRCIQETLNKTGLDYIDLYLIHAPYGGKDARKGAWKALVEAQEDGKTRSLGVSNYGMHHLSELEDYIAVREASLGKGRGGIISAGQWELHPWMSRPEIVRWCQSRGIIIEVRYLLTLSDL